MNTDYFSSSTFSTVLAWITCVGALVSLIFSAVGLVLEQNKDVPKILFLWIFVCIILFSPLRYLVLQLLMGFSFPFQSFRALLSTFVLVLYVPIVYLLLFVIGVGLPTFVSLKIAGKNGKKGLIRWARLLASAVAAPVVCALSFWLFFLLLEYAAFTTHWLRSEDVIKATNGPSLAAYKYVLKHYMPLPVSNQLTGAIIDDRDMLRGHVASYYLGKWQYARYIKHGYPALYEQLNRQP